MVSSVVRGKATLCFKKPLAVSHSCINSDNGVDFPDTTCKRIALNANKTAEGNGSLKQDSNLDALIPQQTKSAHTLPCLKIQVENQLCYNSQLQQCHFQQASRQRQFQLHSTTESIQYHLSCWSYYDKD